VKVKQIMNAVPVTARESSGLDSIVRVFGEQDIGWMPILDEMGRVAGTITDLEVCTAALSRNRRLADLTAASVMSRNVVLCQETASRDEVEKTLRLHHLHEIPVVDAQGRLSGVITWDDLRMVQ